MHSNMSVLGHNRLKRGFGAVVVMLSHLVFGVKVQPSRLKGPQKNGAPQERQQVGVPPRSRRKQTQAKFSILPSSGRKVMLLQKEVKVINLDYDYGQ